MERVLIFGATSAIAAEVAAVHAARDDRLHLVARNAEKLARLVERLPRHSVTTTVADFSQLDESAALVDRCLEDLHGVDRVLFAHGDLGDQRESERSFEAAESIIVANFLSTVALLIPIANYLERSGRGRIGVITSVAGDRGRPRNYTYGASKGALNIYLQGLRSRLFASGVTVTTLKLGPVDTPMTTSHRKNALFAKPETVARQIVTVMDDRILEAYVPSFWAAIMPIVRNTPERLFQKLPFLSGR